MKTTPIDPELIEIINELHWMARRYADGRSTYAPVTFNECTRKLLKRGIKLNKPDKVLFATDGMGRNYDRLSEKEFKTKKLKDE